MSQRLQGPAFTSFRSPPRAHASKRQTRAGLPPGQSWSSHNGHRQRVKNLRMVCHRVLTSKDPEVLAALARVKALTEDEPEPDLGYLNLTAASIELAAETGVSWVRAATTLVEKYSAKFAPSEMEIRYEDDAGPTENPKP